MATVTVTLQASLDQPRASARAGGVVAKSFSGLSQAQAIGTAGDVVLLAKLPNQAQVIDILGNVQCASTSLQGILAICEVLTGGTLSFRTTLCSLSAVTAGGALKTGVFVPAKVSLSDDAAVQYAMLALKFSSGSSSTSFSINGAVLYTTTGE